MRRHSAPSSLHSARRKNRQRYGNVFHQRPSKSSWRRVPPTEPRFDLSTIHHSPFPECKKHDITTGRFLPNLCGAQYLSNQFLLPSPPSRKNPGNTQSWCTNKIIATPHPYLICRSCKFPTSGDENTSPTGDGTGLPVKGRSGRADEPECPRSRNNTRSMEFDQEFFKLAGD